MENRNYYFVHIPKNGGSSLVELLKNPDVDVGNNIRYIGHNYPKVHKNEIIVLRNPIDRFISAFFYRVQNLDHIANPEKYRIANGKFETVNEFAESLTDKTSRNHDYANLIFRNQENHRINNRYIKTRWVFTEQNEWVNNPEYILRFSHLEEDFNKCLKDIGLSKRVSLPRKNTSVHKDIYLSPKSLAFLRNFYRKDFELLESNPFTFGNLTETFQNNSSSIHLEAVDLPHQRPHDTAD